MLEPSSKFLKSVSPVNKQSKEPPSNSFSMAQGFHQLQEESKFNNVMDQVKIQDQNKNLQKGLSKNVDSLNIISNKLHKESLD